MSVTSKQIVIYINKEQLKQLLQDDYFVGYAPLWGSKITGGTYNKSNVFFQLRKSVQA